MLEAVSAYLKLRADEDSGEFCLQARKAEGTLSFWNVILVSNSMELIGTEKHSITDYTELKRHFQRVPAAACQVLMSTV